MGVCCGGVATCWLFCDKLDGRFICGLVLIQIFVVILVLVAA